MIIEILTGSLVGEAIRRNQKRIRCFLFGHPMRYSEFDTRYRAPEGCKRYVCARCDKRHMTDGTPEKLYKLIALRGPFWGRWR